MERRLVLPEQHLAGYDSLYRSLAQVATAADTHFIFAPNRAYDAYHRLPKTFANEAGAPQLFAIANALRHEWMPRYLEAGGWAAAEGALASNDLSTIDRIRALDDAEEMWMRALERNIAMDTTEGREWLRDASAPYRNAIDIAHIPLMKSLVSGDITATVRERVFADTLAIAQAADVQQAFARKAGDKLIAADLLGFGHECTALLTLQYLDDPRYVPIPSSARAGAGYDYPNQTHDLTVINQHFGDILKVIPVEVKSKASLQHLKRYDALIVRGKMHLSLPGRFLPQHTHDAFAAAYEGTATDIDLQTVENATQVFCDLLKEYQKGGRQDAGVADTPMRFHDTSALAARFREFSLERAS